MNGQIQCNSSPITLMFNMCGQVLCLMAYNTLLLACIAYHNKFGGEDVEKRRFSLLIHLGLFKYIKLHLRYHSANSSQILINAVLDIYPEP